MFEGVVIGYTDDGVPIADLLSANGQFDLVAVLEGRCAVLAPLTCSEFAGAVYLQAIFHSGKPGAMPWQKSAK